NSKHITPDNIFHLSGVMKLNMTVHYAPVCARSRTSVLYDPGFAIRVNYFLWGA
ncbi:MAG: hypothetical protein BECKG1743F_GA0114225_112151, partial [Candidatus Kentron sp. G]